jgi:curved DNA-binding protein CbpA
MNFRKACEILDIDCEDPTVELIKKQYRIKALKYHPDKTGNDPDLEIKFKELNEAYEVLSDPALPELWAFKGGFPSRNKKIISFFFVLPSHT